MEFSTVSRVSRLHPAGATYHASPCHHRVTHATNVKWLRPCSTTFAVAMLLVGRASETYAQANCVTADLMEAEGIVATCCESVDGGCESAFPATCTHTCASLVVRQTSTWSTLVSQCRHVQALTTIKGFRSSSAIRSWGCVSYLPAQRL